MQLYNYKNFIFETFGGEDNESETKRKPALKEAPLILSDKLKKVLKSLNLPISNAILKEEGSIRDISFLDYIDDDKDKNDKITYLPVGKIPIGMLSDQHVNIKLAWEAKGRQEMSVGRIVNKLLPEKFKQSEVEVFVNDFKAEVSKVFSSFKLVDGEDIRHWYLYTNYESQNAGDINNSCMKGVKAQTFFDIYVMNPDKCKLLVLMSDKDKTKIKGRALVWFDLRKPTGRVYMDRIYTVYPQDQKLFIDYAIEHNWLYKAAQVMHDPSYIDNGKKVNSSVAIQLKPGAYRAYPSLDTFPYYTPTTGRLGSNPGNYIQGNPRFQLNHTDGGASKIDR